MKLLLGVQDVAYTDAEGTTTTGQVAEYLEKQYHVMRTFVELYETKIGEHLCDEVAGAIEDLAHGRPMNLDSVGPMHKIEDDFRDYLDRGEWESTSGQVIQAAREGISHRFKSVSGKTVSARSIASGKVKAKGMVLKRGRGPRKAFIDTGLYQASFAVWVKK
ncbi:MAG: hypothetical protein ACYCOR_13615 [Acidobacteriaceae bacterium]